jgi:Protein of unknown function (DUF1045)
MLSFHDNSRSPNRYRYAVYFTPRANTQWALAGSQWLGRCIFSGKVFEAPVVEGMTPNELNALTQEPRRYGWHATLKAPFRLAVNPQAASEGALVDAMTRLVSSMQAFTLPPLRVGMMRNFVALRADGDQKRINAIARACVTNLHYLAQELDEQALARRRKAHLSPEQDRMLVQWGYPWVLEQFQFHLSLSGPVDRLNLDTRWALLNAAQQHFAIEEDCRFDQISLFFEPHPDAPFELIESFDLLR